MQSSVKWVLTPKVEQTEGQAVEIVVTNPEKKNTRNYYSILLFFKEKLLHTRISVTKWNMAWLMRQHGNILPSASQ